MVQPVPRAILLLQSGFQFAGVLQLDAVQRQTSRIQTERFVAQLTFTSATAPLEKTSLRSFLKEPVMDI
jgi:hypothetical protein